MVAITLPLAVFLPVSSASGIERDREPGRQGRYVETVGAPGIGGMFEHREELGRRRKS